MNTIDEIKFMWKHDKVRFFFFIAVILFSLSLIFSLCSCGTIHKTLNKETDKSIVKTDSVAHIETKVVEHIDTSVSTIQDTTQAILNIPDTSEQVIETPELKITFSAPVNGKRKLTVIEKPKSINLKIDKTTFVNSNIEVKKQDSETKKTESKVTDKSGFQIPFYVWIILVVLVALFLWWKFGKLL